MFFFFIRSHKQNIEEIRFIVYHKKTTVLIVEVLRCRLDKTQLAQSQYPYTYLVAE